MPISINHIKEQVRSIFVEYAGETATIIYYPHKVTKSLIREVAALEGDGVDRLIEQLVRIVHAWEVLDDDGHPLPPTAEVMAEFPLDFLTAIMRAINEASVPGEGSGASMSSI